MLAREIWQVAKRALVERHAQKSSGELVSDLLPMVLLDRWPPLRMPTQDEMAAKHGTTPVKLKAFFNRTLKTLARSRFDEAATEACPGIAMQDTYHLGHLLCRYGEE